MKNIIYSMFAALAFCAVTALPAAAQEDSAAEEKPALPALTQALSEKTPVNSAKLNKKASVFFVYKSRSTCGICVAELPMINKAYKEMKGKGAEIVMYNIDADDATAKSWATKGKIKFPMIGPKDHRGLPFPYTRGGLLPYLVVLDAEGNKLDEAGGDKVAAMMANWKTYVTKMKKQKKSKKS